MFAALALLALATPTAPRAATADVTISGFAFQPATVTVRVGDAVRWTNLDGAPHSAAGSAFTTPVLRQGQSALVTFSTAGTFDYVCGVHGPSMSGTVVVIAAATPAPTVPPTPAPTAPPVRTAPPTVAPTAAPATAPPSPASPASTVAPAPAAPSGTPTSPALATAAPTGAPAVGVATDAGVPPLALAAGAAVALGVAGAAWRLLRR